jgi:hypothetical protein
MAVVVNPGVICGSRTPEHKSNRIRITVYRTAHADTAPVSLLHVDMVRVAKVSELYPASIFRFDVNRADIRVIICYCLTDRRVCLGFEPCLYS